MQDNQRQHSGIETARRIVSAARIAKAAAAGGVHGAAVAAAKEAAPFLAKLAIWVKQAVIYSRGHGFGVPRFGVHILEI